MPECGMRDKAATSTTEKYSSLSSTYLVEPIAGESLGMLSLSTLNLLYDFSRRISDKSGDVRESSYVGYSNAFLLRFSVSIRCFCMTLWLSTHRSGIARNGQWKGLQSVADAEVGARGRVRYGGSLQGTGPNYPNQPIFAILYRLSYLRNGYEDFKFGK